MRTILIYLLLGIALNSCGPSEREIQETAMAQMKMWIEEKNNLEKQAEELEIKLTSNGDAYEDLIASIEAEKVRLRDIEKFHLLRTSSEKEEQIKAHVKYIRILESKVPEFERVIEVQKQSTIELNKSILELTFKV